MEKLIESLSPIERAIIPYLHQTVEEIIECASLDRTTVIRALMFLENKGFITLQTIKTSNVCLGVNGTYYKKNGLPERTLMHTVEQNNYKSLEDMRVLTKLSDNEFKAALGVLKRKNLITLTGGKIAIAGKKEELTKKFPEEIILE